MFIAFRILYKAVIFIVLFFLLGTLFVYFEDLAIRGNNISLVDESVIDGDWINYGTENIDEKSYIPLIASLISSYIIAFYIPWFKKSSN